MTIAIGALYSDGVIVAADSKVVFSDGSTDTDTKLSLSMSPERAMLAIADAAEDGRAAKTVAGGIGSAFIDAHRERKSPEILLRNAMGRWYRSYGHSQPPGIEFLVGKVIVDNWAGLYYLQPPSTILLKAPMAIGRGARPVEPLLGLLDNEKTPLKSQLLLIAYLMHLAKEEEGSACGGRTTVLVVAKDGSFTFVDEMDAAEKLAAEIHSSIQQCVREMVGAATRFPTTPFQELQKDLLSKAEKFEFASLRHLERNVWKRRKPRQLTPRKSEAQ
jgi:20S proteasome alpha/beta subunit